MSNPLPVSDAYWVVPDRFLAGEYPGAYDAAHAREKLARFLDAGIRTFVDLTEDGELEPYDALLRVLAQERGIECRHVRYGIRDMGVPDGQLLRRILDTIDQEIAGGGSVYVHCWGGIGRTGTVVGCWLVCHGVGGAEALGRIRELRAGTPDASRASPETDAQRTLILEMMPGGST